VCKELGVQDKFAFYQLTFRRSKICLFETYHGERNHLEKSKNWYSFIRSFLLQLKKEPKPQGEAQALPFRLKAAAVVCVV